MGIIPDWKPVCYNLSQIQIPYFLPKTNQTKVEISAQYTTISRLDQGDLNLQFYFH